MAVRSVVTLLILATAPLLGAGTPSWHCWGPGLPDPCRNTLEGVAMVPGSGTGAAWAVGRAGTVLLWNGSSWRKVASGTDGDLLDVAMARTDLGWAVGTEGELIQWDGSRWYRPSPFTSNWIRTVTVVPGIDTVRAWAAADKYGVGSFAYWDGSRWQSRYQGDTQTFGGTIYDIAMLSQDEGWAVGAVLGDVGSGITMIGQVLHFDGAGWSSFLQVEKPLRGVAFSAPDDGWAVGDEGTILHWDGFEWTGIEPVEEIELDDVAAPAADNAWAVGLAGTLLHWDGSGWSEAASPAPGFNLESLTMTAGGDGWTVGEGGAVLRWDGDSWRAALELPLARLEAVARVPGSDGDDLWAGGYGSELLHWDGLRWSRVPGHGGSCRDLALSGSTDGWAVSSSGLARWDGFQWRDTAAPASAGAVVTLGPDDAWTVGWGTIQHWDGHQWSLVTSPTTTTLRGISAVAPDAIWAVGYSGTALRYDGTAWSEVPAPADLNLGDVSMASRQLGFAVASSYGAGIALQWNGTRWGTMTLPDDTPSLAAVDVRDTGSGVVGFMVGDAGFARRLANSTWRDDPAPTSNDLLDVVMVSATEAWAVGDNGVLLHWSDGQDATVPTGAVVAAAAKLAGQAGTDWRTDLVVTNLGGARTTATIEAWLRDQANPDPLRQTMPLLAMQTYAAGDVLGSLFGLPDSSAATLVITADQPVGIASRTYNLTPGGTYGQSIAAAPLASAFAPGQVAHLIGLVENQSYRSNLGLVNPGEEPLTVQAAFFAADGGSLGTVLYEVPPRGSIQRNRVLRDVASGRVDLARVELRPTGSDLMAFLSVVDAATGDPVFQPAVAASSGVTELVLQGIAKVAGAAGTDWRSSLVIANTSTRPLTTPLELLRRGTANPAPEVASLVLAAGEVRQVDDVMASLFGLGSGAASLRVRVASGVLLGGRTFNQTAAGTYGQYIPAQGGDTAITGIARGVLVGVVQNEEFRSNLGLTNPSTVPAEVVLKLVSSSGPQAGSQRTIPLAAGEVVQLDRVAIQLGVDRIEAATLLVELRSGAEIQAFLSVVDSRTGDPVFQLPTTVAR